ncbi:MAG: hypothetical protein ABIG44_12010 [Planctomycetota bacterium]
MSNHTTPVKSFFQDESAVTTNEYAAILAVLVLAIVATVSLIGDHIGEFFGTLATAVGSVL